MPDKNDDSPYFRMQPLDDQETLNANKEQAESKTEWGWVWCVLIALMCYMGSKAGRVILGGILGIIIGGFVGAILPIVLRELVFAIRASYRMLYQTKLSHGLRKISQKGRDVLSHGFRVWYQNYRDR